MNKYFLTLISRCRDEPFLKEFVDHYFNEGVDFIYLIDDNVKTQIPSDILNNSDINILKANNWNDTNKLQMADVDVLFRNIQMLSQWFIFVDCDEFITSKQNFNNTIKDELSTTFKDFDCVKVPWAFMSCEQRKKDPEHLLESMIKSSTYGAFRGFTR